MLGSSRVHRELLSRLTKIARTDAEVLICGPSGSGKELYAEYIHENSRRSGRELVPVNCGTLTNDLLDNVMFGHVGGAFTGARAESEGLVHTAEGGTLFLDEVDALSVPCQIKLLRFLQDRSYRRLGETRLCHADVRIIAACNGDLVAAIDEGKFRQDLFFRLRVVPVDVPPLSNRMEDLDQLFEHFAQQAAKEYDLQPIVLSEAARDRLHKYSWPGNIRELQNCVRYLTCLQKDGPIQPDEPPLLDPPPNKDDAEIALADMLTSGHRPLKVVKGEVVEKLERCYIEKALSKSNGNVSKAARRSGKARRAFFELMRKHEIDPAKFRPMTRN